MWLSVVQENKGAEGEQRTRLEAHQGPDQDYNNQLSGPLPQNKY